MSLPHLPPHHLKMTSFGSMGSASDLGAHHGSWHSMRLRRTVKKSRFFTRPWGSLNLGVEGPLEHGKLQPSHQLVDEVGQPPSIANSVKGSSMVPSDVHWWYMQLQNNRCPKDFFDALPYGHAVGMAERQNRQ